MTEKKAFGYTITQHEEDGRWIVVIGDLANGGWYVHGFTSEEAAGGWLLEFIERNYVTMTRMADERLMRTQQLQANLELARQEMLARLMEPSTKQ